MPAIILSALLGKAKALLSNKYTLIIFGVIALVGGGYLYLHHDVNKQVAAKVEQHDDKATIHSFQTKDQVTTATRKIDNKYDTIAVKTAQDYDNVRYTQTTPPSYTGEDTPLDPLILDTLNRLAGLHGSGAASDGLSNATD